EPPALLAPQPGPQQRGRPPHRGAPILPMVQRTAAHLAPIPTAPQQQRRLFGVGAPTAVAPVALDAQLLAPAEQPGPPRIRAVLAGDRVATGRPAPPAPPAPAAEVPQQLEKPAAPLGNVHGHFNRV